MVSLLSLPKGEPRTIPFQPRNSRSSLISPSLARVGAWPQSGNVTSRGFGPRRVISSAITSGSTSDADADEAGTESAVGAGVVVGDPWVRATVGSISVGPGAVNAIPSRVRFTLEIRAASDATRVAFETGILGRAQEICAAAGCEIEAGRTYVQPATTCDPRLTEALEQAIRDHGIRPMTIPSGATHDASAMADLCPVSMLFVRCRGGVSHRPDEFASAEDLDVAIAVLERAILRLARQG